MVPKDSPDVTVSFRRVRPRLAFALLALVAVVALATGVTAGAGREDGAVEQARIVLPQPEQRENRPAPRGPSVPPSVSDLARRLPLERKVAQLFLFGFEGTDLNAEIFRRLRRFDLGGIVIGPDNYTDPTLLGEMGGEAVVISRDEEHVPPWVLTVQDGGEFNSLAGLPPSLVPADIAASKEAAALAQDTAKTLRGLNVTGVLGPNADVGLASGSALGARVYSDDPEEVSSYVDAVIEAYRRERLFGAVKHFPGLGAADQSTELGPASVGLDLEGLRERDLLPFRAAVRAGAPAVVLSHALYPVTDFTQPASLSRAVATDLLRGELGFAGVAITDDLADPAITTPYSVSDATLQALRAGADMVWISGPAADQQAAYAAALRAARSGRLPRSRLNEALLRVLKAKEDYGRIR